MKRTPLSRGKPLARGSGLKRGGRIKPKVKTDEEREARELWRVDVLAQGKIRCERCRVRWRVLDAHHLWTAGRGGPDELWNSACLCRSCHDAIHDHLCEGWADWLASSEEEARRIRERLDERIAR